MSEKAQNGVESGCKICQGSTSHLLICCGNPICIGCFGSINQQSDGETKSPLCPFCRKPNSQLCPIEPLSTEQIRAMKRAEIAAKVALARQKQAEEAMLEQFVSMFGALGTALSSCSAANPRLPRIRNIRESFKRILDDQTLTQEEFLYTMNQAYNEAQKEFETDCGLWQLKVSCWDFNIKQLQHICAEMLKLPPGTPILSPLAGRGFLESCLQRFGLVVICNDIENPADEFTFVDAAQMSCRDGFDFLKSYHAEHPDIQFAILVSWAPQKGHLGSEISEKIFTFASDCPKSVGVFHVSEGNQDDGNYGCTDTEEAFAVIEAKFTRVLKIPRQRPIWKKTDPSHADIADYLSWRVPRRGSKK
jgi:hypothetical protein